MGCSSALLRSTNRRRRPALLRLCVVERGFLVVERILLCMRFMRPLFLAPNNSRVGVNLVGVDVQDEIWAP